MLLSYSSDGVYLYSTQDDPGMPRKDRAMLRPNKRMRPSSPPAQAAPSGPTENSVTGSSISDALMEEDIDRFMDEVQSEDEEDVGKYQKSVLSLSFTRPSSPQPPMSSVHQACWRSSRTYHSPTSRAAVVSVPSTVGRGDGDNMRFTAAHTVMPSMYTL